MNRQKGFKNLTHFPPIIGIEQVEIKTKPKGENNARFIKRGPGVRPLRNEEDYGRKWKYKLCHMSMGSLLYLLGVLGGQ